jgi:hypothetical protein
MGVTSRVGSEPAAGAGGPPPLLTQWSVTLLSSSRVL